ncbi:MAG: tyrosine-type recombinase/integrase [Candidatus Pacebacteria bacterium]|nr:tyrosine-type recombinase/integrase [Candidatus Paceibacterota bacterium]
MKKSKKDYCNNLTEIEGKIKEIKEEFCDGKKQKKFAFLMKGEPFSRLKPRKSRFAWSLDEDKYLSIDRVSRLREYCQKQKDKALQRDRTIPVRDWFMVELGLNAGLRVKEMANLKCGDLLLENDQSSITVIGKRNKKRAIWISPCFKKECLWYLNWKKESGQPVAPGSFLLSLNNGNQLTRRALQKAFKKCMRKAGLPVHYGIHSLRHTYGSNLYITSNHDLRLVQKQMGHSSVRTTEIYTNLMDPHTREALEKLYKK